MSIPGAGPVEALFDEEANRLGAIAAYVMQVRQDGPQWVTEEEWQTIHAAKKIMHYLAAKACCRPEFVDHVRGFEPERDGFKLGSGPG